MKNEAVVLQTGLRSLPLAGRGKVRDIYEVDADRLLLVQTDRVSAFDLVLGEGIPGKGAALTAMSRFWFRKLAGLARNHFLPDEPESVVAADERETVRGRAMVARRMKPLPLEAICRGYLAGSGWKDYRETGRVSGVELPAGLRLAEKFPSPIYTPSTKAEQGAHDEAISFAETERLVGPALAGRVRDSALALYSAAAAFAETRGILIADTKFEFAADADGEVVLIDEALTPDSSRFWPQSEWVAGENPPSFDKQYLRDWLAESGWDRKGPPPPLPPEVVQNAAQKYREIRERLTGE